jgi:CubicO group peptidase (beta-lactamase class C family)
MRRRRCLGWAAAGLAAPLAVACPHVATEPGTAPDVATAVTATTAAASAADPAARAASGAAHAAVARAIEAGAAQAPLTHGVVVEQGGRLVGEAYFTADDKPSGSWSTRRVAFNAETLHDMRSISKSVVGLLVGVAEARGRLDRGRPVLDWFPEHAALATPERRAIRLEHLLTITAGLAWDETGVSYANPDNSETRMGFSLDPVGYVLTRDVVAAPGSRFVYSGGATLLLSEIVERATGQTVDALAREALFAPLGIERFEWRRHPIWDKPLAYSGLRLAPRSMVRLGQLMLERGRHAGVQLVPSEWVASLQQRHVADTGQGMGYGWQWWVGRFPRGPAAGLDWFAGRGNGGQVLMVVPRLDAVVAVTAGRYNDPAGGRPSLRICQAVIEALVGREFGT